MDTTRHGVNSEQLKGHIKACFRTEVAFDDIVMNCNNSEAMELAQRIKGKTWIAVTEDREIYEYTAAGFGFLTAAAQIYYLPALLYAAVDREADYYTECLLYWLKYETAVAKHSNEQATLYLLTKEQRVVVTKVLEFGKRNYGDPGSEMCEEILAIL